MVALIWFSQQRLPASVAGVQETRVSPVYALSREQRVGGALFSRQSFAVVLRLTPPSTNGGQGCEVPACAGTTGANRPLHRATLRLAHGGGWKGDEISPLQGRPQSLRGVGDGGGAPVASGEAWERQAYGL